MAFKMKGNPYKMGKIATKSAMNMGKKSPMKAEGDPNKTDKPKDKSYLQKAYDKASQIGMGVRGVLSAMGDDEASQRRIYSGEDLDFRKAYRDARDKEKAHDDASPMKTGHKYNMSKNLKDKTEYDPRVETREEVMKANALEDKNNDAAAKRAYAKMMAKKAKSKAKAKAKNTPMKKGKKGSHAHGSVSGEKGSKERRLKTTRAKLINKQHAKKKGTLGNAIRKSRVKRINRKLKADGTFYSDKDSKTKSVRDGGRIEF